MSLKRQTLWVCLFYFTENKSIKMKISILLFLFFCQLSYAETKPDDILGTWISANQDLKVEIFKQNNKYFGKIVWFKCSPGQSPMQSYLDRENSNIKLRNRPWLGMVNVENLMFDNDNRWTGGSIYDPNSGRTYSSTVKTKGQNELVVRGFWGFEFIGKSMIFKRI